MGGIADAPVAVQVVGCDRVFDEQQVVGLERAGQPCRVAGRHPRWAVQVDHDVHLVADRLAQGCHLAYRVRHATAFDRRDTACLQAERNLWRIRMGIDANPVAHQSTEQVPHRHAQGLAFDVPQRHVDAGHCTGADSAGHAVHHDGRHHALPQTFNVGRILADQDALEVVDRGLDDAGPA